MNFNCNWCGKTCERVWEIPEGAGADKAWVCKECHSCYFDEDCDDSKRRERRTI